MYKILLLAPFFLLLSQQDVQLLGRWKLIMDEGRSTDERIELLFTANHTMEFFKNDKSKTGSWRLVQGKNETLLRIHLENEEKEDILKLRFLGDSLYLSIGDEDAIFLKVR